jgi:DNA-binding CsgD family transcriptional regulator/PAS domain-containing protein
MGERAGGSERGPLSDADASPLATASSDEINLVLGRCEFPVIVWTPPEGTILLANDAAAELFNVPLETLVGRPVFDYFEPRQAIERAASVLASGEVDGSSGRRRLRRNELGKVPVQFWNRAIELDGHRRIVALFLPSGELAALGPDPGRPWKQLTPIAVGVADEDWRIVEVSADIWDLVGLAPDDLIGTDLRQLFTLGDSATIRSSDWAHAAVEALDLRHLRLADNSGNGDEVSLMLAPWGKRPGSSMFAVVGVPHCHEGTASDRIVDLETRLRRIAAEVRAAGLLEAVDTLPSIEEHPKFGELSTRQWEVLSLLMQGQRVATIASNLFVSQSTVRNHLAAIFQKFGVHSQAQLLALLASKPSADRG